MDKAELLKMLDDVAAGKTTPEDAALRLKTKPFDELGFAMPDYHRGIRQGVGEIIYGAGKTPEQIAAISQNLLENRQSRILITRMSKEAYDYAKNTLEIEYYENAKIGIIGEMPSEKTESVILVITAGTSDIPVAEEAALTAEFLGNKVKRVYDAGVAGIHRLLAHYEDIMSAKVIIAIAGMEGALASVVGGLADCPVIAVPTSIGYGASFGGVSALLSMLNSCASGVTVVNIDNGFGAAYTASMINKG
ncbi:MAG: nickel pincer cofactor biosynthesis protein LarB [Firmicutes bacterium]|nr:nickel pincer cofactor biosynthesis protein LarB [Bacillota bacterium]MBQ9605509.1 nickel pincer cofactor biosynthesis protein LarB [Bacillota bacterium]